MGLTRVLICGQTALSLVLLTGALLFTRSLMNLRNADAGFERNGVLFIQLYPQSHAPEHAVPFQTAYHRELVERLRGIPGVDAVSYSHMGPVSHYEYMEPASVTGVAVPAAFEAVAPGFFHLVRMRVLAGRDFDWRDTDTSRRVAIVSENLARRLFPSGNAVGSRIDFGRYKALEVVGVVNNASLWKPQTREPMAVYLPLAQIPHYDSSNLDIRFSGDLASVLPAVRRVILSLGKHFSLHEDTLERRSAVVMASERITAVLSAFFGGLALLLVSVGLYGITSYAVARRTAEIGLRMALGARPGAVLVYVLKDVMRLVLAGIAIGIPAALAASRLVSGMVYGVDPNDPLTMTAACCTLVAAAAVAAWVPARRASRIDPISALRAE
jgi:predicted permease